MNNFLRDLYGHQAWADAEHWRAIDGHPQALIDEKIRDRLFHYQLTQRAFLLIAKAEELTFPNRKNIPPMNILKESAREYHNEVLAFMNSVSDARLEEIVTIPWFRNPPIQITVAQGLVQGALHSHYHRGQNATRLRELGIEPPCTDLIFWWWKGRPEPQWD
jgi:uncharacterized damage-inducible protein DinB